MLIHKPADVLPSEITPRSLFERRRDFLARSGAGLVAGAALWHGLPAAAGQALDPHDEDRLDVLHIATEQGAVQLKPVKPCPRCPIPNIDPATAASSPEVGDMLQRYRQDARVNGAVTFGMNAIVLQGVDHLLKVGQAVGANYRFE